MNLERSPLVTTDWLAAHLTDPDLRIVDVGWRSRYENGRGINTRTLRIVFASAPDPVKDPLVTSLARPGDEVIQ